MENIKEIQATTEPVKTTTRYLLLTKPIDEDWFVHPIETNKSAVLKAAKCFPDYQHQIVTVELPI